MHRGWLRGDVDEMRSAVFAFRDHAGGIGLPPLRLHQGTSASMLLGIFALQVIAFVAFAMATAFGGTPLQMGAAFASYAPSGGSIADRLPLPVADALAAQDLKRHVLPELLGLVRFRELAHVQHAHRHARGAGIRTGDPAAGAVRGGAAPVQRRGGDRPGQVRCQRLGRADRHRGTAADRAGAPGVPGRVVPARRASTSANAWSSSPAGASINMPSWPLT